MPSPGDHFDGYTLIRRIGQGGFGEVWLCRSSAMGDWRALKFIPAANGGALDKEHEALVRYRRAAAQLRTPSLTPIEHVNRCESGLYYVMPLADGDGADSPESPEWHPRTLRSVLDAKRNTPAWFTSGEVISLMEPLLVGLQCLVDAGLVHRDIKPDNILFFGGKPCLGDISLMTDDRTRITRHGTPGYSSPSWFVGGHHDMYGAAATLYTLLTGNEPDRMGRAAFNWPPQGEGSLSEEERRQWLRLHGVIRRATDETPAERFPDFGAMLGSLQIRAASSTNAEAPQLTGTNDGASKYAVLKTPAVIGVLLGILAIATFTFEGYGMVISVAAIISSVIGLQSVRKKTAAVGLALGVFGLLFAVMNLIMEMFGAFSQTMKDTGADTSPAAQVLAVKPDDRYAELLTEDWKNMEVFRKRTQSTLDWAERELAPLHQRVENLKKSLPKADHAVAEIRSIKAASDRLIKEAPASRLKSLEEAITRSAGLYRQAKTIPTTAAERLNFEKNIAPKFAEGPGEVSQITFTDMRWETRDLGWLVNDLAVQDMRAVSKALSENNTDGRYSEAISLLPETLASITQLSQKITK